MLFFVFLLSALPTHADEALNNALFDAVKTGDKAKVEALIAKGADVNARDNYGETPLDMAVDNEYKDVVELLQRKTVK